MKQTRLLLWALLAVLALALLFTRSDAYVDRSGPAATDEEAQVVRVSIRSGQYVPASVRVQAGTTVVWRNEDRTPHTVTGSDGSWDSGMIQPGGTFSRKFERTGTLSYYCVPHPEMRGSVEVTVAR